MDSIILKNMPKQIQGKSLFFEKYKLESFFHPIVSSKNATILGYESLIRGYDPENQNLLSPLDLFKLVKSNEDLIELDRACRSTALHSFVELYQKNKDLLLFVNFETSILDLGVLGSNYIYNLCQDLNIPPEQIVIEIVESNVRDTSNLQKFIDTYRGYGFSIALDDVGAGHSNFDRIPLIKPDIIKINGILIQNIKTNFFQQEVFKSIVNLSKKLGALVVAEWVENEEEALFALESGAEFLQGFYFDFPKPPKEINLTCCYNKIEYISGRYEEHIINNMQREAENQAKYHKISQKISEKVAECEITASESFLQEIIKKYAFIECVYLLNHHGQQITTTIFNVDIESKSSQLYSPADKGANHSMKEYYFVIDDLSRQTYMTQPYISMASGNLCITYSALIENKSGEKYILCLDINPNSTYWDEKLQS